MVEVFQAVSSIPSLSHRRSSRRPSCNSSEMMHSTAEVDGRAEIRAELLVLLTGPALLLFPSLPTLFS